MSFQSCFPFLIACKIFFFSFEYSNSFLFQIPSTWNVPKWSFFKSYVWTVWKALMHVTLTVPMSNVREHLPSRLTSEPLPSRCDGYFQTIQRWRFKKTSSWNVPCSFISLTYKEGNNFNTIKKQNKLCRLSLWLNHP